MKRFIWLLAIVVAGQLFASAAASSTDDVEISPVMLNGTVIAAQTAPIEFTSESGLTGHLQLAYSKLVGVDVLVILLQNDGGEYYKNALPIFTKVEEAKKSTKHLGASAPEVEVQVYIGSEAYTHSYSIYCADTNSLVNVSYDIDDNQEGITISIVGRAYCTAKKSLKFKTLKSTDIRKIIVKVDNQEVVIPMNGIESSKFIKRLKKLIK